MTDDATNTQTAAPISRKAILLIIGALALFVGLFLFGRYTEFLDLQALENAMKQFADGPWGVPALILAFCLCAFVGVPQFFLIGMAAVAFGPIAGGVWAWISTLVSGTLTYWLGRVFGAQLLKRFSGPRVSMFTGFIAKNALVASAVVRNAPAGPFLFVNMMFGAVRAPYAYYFVGMAIGVIPKILLVVFGVQAIVAVLKGNIVLAIGAGLAALIIFAGGWYYVRQKRRKGEIIALDAETPVDSASA